VLVLLTTSCDLFAQRTISDSRARSDKFSALSTKVRHESFGGIRISATLPQAGVGKAFNAVLSVSGGSSPYQFALGGGTLASGLSLNGQTGAISVCLWLRAAIVLRWWSQTFQGKNRETNG